jgi:hypothetical protein
MELRRQNNSPKKDKNAILTCPTDIFQEDLCLNLAED